ncbi:MAG: transcriptional regulator [Alphaproteobacteria bacterium]|nr:transcriptional regulator [Alphaproteobacteria bacterium]
MRIRPIKTKDDFEEALSMIDQLWNAEYGSSDYDYFETLAICIESYERERNIIEFADPIEAIRYYMQQRGKSFEDLSELLESSDTAFQVLYREVPLTIAMIWKLCKSWDIPAECLIKPYQLNPSSNKTSKTRRDEGSLSKVLPNSETLALTKTVGHS